MEKGTGRIREENEESDGYMGKCFRPRNARGFVTENEKPESN
jgi:hypothetical protein